MRTIVFLVLFVLLAAAVLHRPMLDTLLFAVALAVGLTLEFLPMITTVTLAQGAVRMARQHVIVRHLAAIEASGKPNTQVATLLVTMGRSRLRGVGRDPTTGRVLGR
jgi:Mg2+-importing ATPase